MQRPVKQVLLIAANSWTEGLVNEAVDEIRDWRILGHDYQLVPVGSLTEALDLIERAAFDVILLDPFVPDYRPMDAFLELRAATQEFPIVLLCGKDDEPLAIRALQEGAQDYLIVEEIDCLPFARALRSAMERFSAAQAANPVNFYDPVTGFYNKEGFLLLAGYMLRHARAQSSSAGLLLLDMPDDCLTKRNREFNILRLLDLSELIRGALGETDIAGRLSASQFAALAAEPNMRALERLREALAAALPEVRVGYASSAVTELALAVAAGSSSRGAVQAGLPVSIHDLVEAAANRLCENGSKELALSQRFGARQK